MKEYIVEPKDDGSLAVTVRDGRVAVKFENVIVEPFSEDINEENVWLIPDFAENVGEVPLETITLEECEAMFDEWHLRGLQQHYGWSDEKTARVKQLAIDMGIWNTEER